MADPTTSHTGVASIGISVKIDSLVLPVTSIPDIGGSPELLETTTLADSQQYFVTGVQSFDSMDFECNYEPGAFATLKTYADARTTKEVTISLPAFNGENAKTITYNAYIGVKISGAGVNEVIKMTVTTACASAFTIA